MKIVPFPQGSPGWHAVRARCRTASEASAMMGASHHLSRGALLRQKSTGLAPEVDAFTQALFERGHAAEHGARAIVEEMLGDELYPVTGTDDAGWLLASFDGITMDGSTGFEGKLWNEELAARVRTRDLEPHYYWQLEQQILVGGLDRVIFVCSDGTRERFVHMEYRAVPGRAGQLIAGWRQFEADLAAYVPQPPAARVAVAAYEVLPAVSVRLEGQLVVASNLPDFAVALRGFVECIPAEPETDQEFADCEAACKALRRAEAALAEAEEWAFAQHSEVDAMRRTIRDLHVLARGARLPRERLVEARKEQIRLEIVQNARALLEAHVAELNRSLGEALMPQIVGDFTGASRNKRSLDGLRDAVDTELAKAKLAANEVAQRIAVNLSALRECQGAASLLADRARLVLKEPQELRAQIAARQTGPQARGEPALSLGRINQRLAPLQISVEGLRSLGFAPAATLKAARLYHEADFPRICAALIEHVRAAGSSGLPLSHQEGIAA